MRGTKRLGRRTVGCCSRAGRGPACRRCRGKGRERSLDDRDEGKNRSSGTENASRAAARPKGPEVFPDVPSRVFGQWARHAPKHGPMPSRLAFAGLSSELLLGSCVRMDEGVHEKSSRWGVCVGGGGGAGVAAMYGFFASVESGAGPHQGREMAWTRARREGFRKCGGWGRCSRLVSCPRWLVV